MKTLTLVLTLIAATPALAQDRPKFNLDKIATVGWASAVTADYITTHRNMRAGFQEKAIHLEWLEEKPTALVAFGVGVDIATAVVWYKMTERHRVIRTIGLVAAASFRLHLAMKNHRALKGGAPIQYPVVPGVYR